jgi:hypothetical protein
MLCEKKMVTFAAPALGGEYVFATYGAASASDGVVQLINATYDSTPIYEHTNFEIRSGYDNYCHGVFVNKNVPEGQTIVLWYWKAKYDPVTGSGAGGYYLGGNLGYTWRDTMYSYGTHYPISITAGVGGVASLDKNPWFFCSTPLLGETNWVWVWDAPAQNYENWHNTSQTHPIHGFYRIDILDVVRATGAYCHRGDGVYDPLYFPGADLDDYDPCHIGILDLVTITGKYAQTFCYQWEDYFCQTTESGTGAFTCTINLGSVRPVVSTEPPEPKIICLHNVNSATLTVTVSSSAPWTITLTGNKVDITKVGWICGTFEQFGTKKVFAFKCYITH